MTDNTPDAPSPDPATQAAADGHPPAVPAYGAPPAYSAPQAPPAYGVPQAPYAGAPQYGSAPQPQYGAPYGGAPQYGYGAPVRTNPLAIVSLIASIVGFVWILPFIGSLAGVITGHIALKQIARSSEAGRGMALAGVIVGWVGLGIVVLAAVGFLFFFVFVAAASGGRYS